ncbi:TetR/AcrR family transcriptional regulator [Mycolicibacterium neoaurum]|uniref:TetR/AcrR family transcriptional regulator n=1 Tax=Mycolicibacterium neoaurum TaxID=1795 RepID=UPI002673A3DA|nr:TetR/AcrR family transcriptional regulator [Mycolicibacterium neoaurum]MDO3401760.1 TetR/AcrR family transcriptional regulator [Mycolicibacterium neoaurum]
MLHTPWAICQQFVRPATRLLCMSQPVRGEVRRSVVIRARELFRDKGVRRVTMSEVAAASGCTRQMLYKVFFDRRELVLAAAVDRIQEIADETAAAGMNGADTSFINSFTEVSVRIIERLREDPELEILFGEGSPVNRYDALWTAELTDRALQFWQPWLDAGQRLRVLRDDLSNHDLADWLHTVYTAMILRHNIPRGEERAMIQRFVLTSLAMATSPGTP